MVGYVVSRQKLVNYPTCSLIFRKLQTGRYCKGLLVERDKVAWHWKNSCIVQANP
jgi:hypothetical protein